MNSDAFLNNKPVLTISRSQFATLKKAAKYASLRRARFCFHKSINDRIQEMVIAFCNDSYVRPHRHANKSESLHVIEGNLLAVFFDNKGNIIKKIKMGPCRSNKDFLYRINTSLWHCLIPLSKYVILHEVVCGPFRKNEQDYAAWSPDENDDENKRLFLLKCLKQKK